MATAWAKLIGDKAMYFVGQYELQNGRSYKEVHKEGVGYDIESFNSLEKRFIEVKGISESWLTYTWQPLHHTEVSFLQKNPNNFYLYIVYFDIPRDNRTQEVLSGAIPTLFVIPGSQLLENFSIKPQSYSLSPISRRKLELYKKKLENYK